MPEVVTWTVAGGSLVFVVGLISALEARKQRKSRPREQIVVRQIFEESSKNTPVEKRTRVETSMAAGGVANGEENLAPVGNSPR